MVAKKDRAYKSLRPIIQLETPPNEEDATLAVGHIDRLLGDAPDRREMFEALGYVPYVGGNTNCGKVTRSLREPQWDIARKVLNERSA